MLSVIIPSRNEFLLSRTVESIFGAAKGEIEIIAVLDGCWDVPKVKDDPRLTLIHHNEPIGQRAAVNEAARLAKGKYILKTDAHSTFDEGFDVKLVENCEYDWTVIPRMYNLHAFDWVCENGHRFYQDKANPHKINKCCDVAKNLLADIYRQVKEIKKKKGEEKSKKYLERKQTEITDIKLLIKLNCEKIVKIKFIWKRRLHKRTDFMSFNNELKVDYWRDYGNRPEAKGDVVDVMNGIGACWFQYRERFLELGGLDEKHGFWGQVGVEVACKAWLSGGRQVVNKKTWFAHVFRTTGSFGFPYKNPGRDQQQAEKHSRNLWLKDKWPLRKRKLQWLIDKFSPVPTWETPKGSNGEYKVEIMSVNDVFKDRIKHTEYRKTEDFLRRFTKSHPDMDEMLRLKALPEKSVENFFKSFQPYVRMILDKVEFKVENTEYHRYLLAHLNPHDILPELSNKGRKHALSKANDAIGLTKDIQANGMQNPLDMWLDKNGDKILRKGFRRLVILKELGIYKMGVRIWKDEETFYKNCKGHIPKKWRKHFAQ